MTAGPIGLGNTGEVRRLALADGRALSYTTYGAPEGRPVLALHGTPGSRLKFRFMDAAARRRGLRLVCPDRWGYGGSDRHPAPSLVAYAEDMAALCDGLGLDRVGLIGISGGGPYATAVAARLGSRVTGLALVSPVGPIAEARRGLGLRFIQWLAFRVVHRLGPVLAALLGVFRQAIRHWPAAGMWIAFVAAARVDREAVARPDVGGGLLATFQEGFRTSAGGMVADVRIFSTRWGFDIAGVTVPSRVWIGTVDTNVPVQAAIGLARQLPRAELVTLAGEGHLWVFEHHDEVLAWLEARAAD